MKDKVYKSYDSLLNGLRQRFINSFKKETNYKFDRISSMAYCGDGFYVNRRDCFMLDRMWVYDMNWAYGSTLVNNKFPLSCEYTDEPTELAIYFCIIKNIHNLDKRHKDFQYTLYRNNIMRYKNEGFILLTNLDYEIFTDLYTNEVEVYKKYYFKDIGYLPDKTKNFVKEQYELKKNSKDNQDFKKAIESVCYGLNAKILKKTNHHLMQKIKYWKAKAETGYEDIRDERTPIAMFQIAYLRYEMWKKFTTYMKDIKYMNGDSIHSTIPLPIETEKGVLGKYKLECEDKLVYYIRRNAYVIVDDDGSIIKPTISGIIDEDTITLDELRILSNGGTVIKHSYKDESRKEIVEVKLNSLFIKNYYGG